MSTGVPAICMDGLANAIFNLTAQCARWQTANTKAGNFAHRDEGIPAYKLKYKRGKKPMKLTILGNNGPFPAAGGACSGYLITEGEHKLLIDCGNGVLSNLQKYTRFEDLDAIILTHLHSDHMSDMMVLRYAVDIKMKRGLMSKPIKVYAPDQPMDEYERLNIGNVFDLAPVDSNTVLNIGDMRLSFAEMKHPVKCFAVSIESKGKRFVFSGDTSWTENIVRFAENADLLMLDAGLLSRDKKDENVPHLTARECGIVAMKSGAKRLLLTHFWPDYDTNELLAEAAEEYPKAEIAKLLAEYDV